MAPRARALGGEPGTGGVPDLFLVGTGDARPGTGLAERTAWLSFAVAGLGFMLGLRTGAEANPVGPAGGGEMARLATSADVI